MIGSLEYLAEKEHQERIEREAYRKEQKAKEEIIKEQNSKKETDFNNFKKLLAQSLRWERAQAIRAYINYLEANPGLKLKGVDNLQEWIVWAKSKADWYDPAVSGNDDY